MTGNITPADIYAMTRNNNENDCFGGFGGVWGIIMLLIIAGIFGGGNGFFGGNGTNTIANDTLLDNEFIKRDIFGTNQNVSTTGCQTQRDVLENRYTTELGLANLGYQTQKCCCDTQRDILENRFQNALQTQTISSQMAQCCCDLKAEGLANTQKILDKLCQNEIDTLRDRLALANNTIATQTISNGVVNAIRPYPTPSYLVGLSSPYQSVYGYGFNNGCGCGFNGFNNNVI